MFDSKSHLYSIYIGQQSPLRILLSLAENITKVDLFKTQQITIHLNNVLL